MQLLGCLDTWRTHRIHDGSLTQRVPLHDWDNSVPYTHGCHFFNVIVGECRARCVRWRRDSKRARGGGSPREAIQNRRAIYPWLNQARNLRFEPHFDLPQYIVSRAPIGCDHSLEPRANSSVRYSGGAGVTLFLRNEIHKWQHFSLALI